MLVQWLAQMSLFGSNNACHVTQTSGEVRAEWPDGSFRAPGRELVASTLVLIKTNWIREKRKSATHASAAKRPNQTLLLDAQDLRSSSASALQIRLTGSAVRRCRWSWASIWETQMQYWLASFKIHQLVFTDPLLLPSQPLLLTSINSDLIALPK